jgi:hypothetical protein
MKALLGDLDADPTGKVALFLRLQYETSRATFWLSRGVSRGVDGQAAAGEAWRGLTITGDFASHESGRGVYRLKLVCGYVGSVVRSYGVDLDMVLVTWL